MSFAGSTCSAPLADAVALTTFASESQCDVRLSWRLVNSRCLCFAPGFSAKMNHLAASWDSLIGTDCSQLVRVAACYWDKDRTEYDHRNCGTPLL